MVENISSKQKMAKTAMILGIVTVASTLMMTVYLPFIFGGIGIIIAILSMGNSKTLESQARLGIILATIGIVVNIVIVTTSVYTVFTNPEAYAEFNRMFVQIYGMDFQDMMSQIRSGGEFL